MPDVIHAAPDADAFLALRAAAGLGARSPEAARAGLARGLFAVSLYQDGALVGMGRIVGDGGVFVALTDVAVHPDHQGRGLGRQIMEELVGWCERELPASCFVSLIANPAVAALYERYGFRREVGMGRTLG